MVQTIPNQADKDVAGAVPAAPPTAANKPKTGPDSVVVAAAGGGNNRRQVVRTDRGRKAGNRRRTVPTRVDSMGADQGTRTATAGPTPHHREGDSARATVHGAAGEPGLSDNPRRAPSNPEGVATAADPMPLGEARAPANP